MCAVTGCMVLVVPLGTLLVFGQLVVLLLVVCIVYWVVCNCVFMVAVGW